MSDPLAHHLAERLAALEAEVFMLRERLDAQHPADDQEPLPPGLTRQPARVLKILRSAKGQPISTGRIRDALYAGRWDATGTASQVRQAIWRLRKAGFKINSVHGFGYQLMETH